MYPVSPGGLHEAIPALKEEIISPTAAWTGLIPPGPRLRACLQALSRYHIILARAPMEQEWPTEKSITTMPSWHSSPGDRLKPA